MGKRQIRVLLVEADPVAAGLFHAQISSDFLTRFEAVAVTSLESALEELQRRPYDVVALDLILPDARGVSTVDRLRAAAPHLPIVVLTGLDDERTAADALQHGAQDYLIKGELTGRLISRSLRYAIERQQLRETLRSLSLLDDPTGFYNRRGFFTLAEQHVKSARRLDCGVGLIGVDLETADAAADLERPARRVAEALRKTFRGSDLIGRIDRSSFLVLTIEPRRRGAETALLRLEGRLGRGDTGVRASAWLHWTDRRDLTTAAELTAAAQARGFLAGEAGTLPGASPDPGPS